MYGVAMTTRFV